MINDFITITLGIQVRLLIYWHVYVYVTQWFTSWQKCMQMTLGCKHSKVDWNTGRFRRDYLWTERHNTKNLIEIQTPFIVIFNFELSIEITYILGPTFEQKCDSHNLFTNFIMLNIVHTTTCSRLSLNSHPPNELAISPFIHLASKNRPMCMRSKNKECFKKTTHSHYSLTWPTINHCLIMPIGWAFHHGFLRLRRSTSNLLPIKFSCMTSPQGPILIIENNQFGTQLSCTDRIDLQFGPIHVTVY
jgi:hypothetical protein